MTILVVEDEQELGKMIQDYLETLGWQTLAASDGNQALDMFRTNSPDFILMDIMMPGLDGLDVLRRMRESSQTPVILLTAMAEESDKLIGLELGADDYIVKPFSLKEVAARIRAVMRRVSRENTGEKSAGGPEESDRTLCIGDLEIDPVRRTVTRGGVPLSLTAVQFDILLGFMKQPGRVFTRAEILGFFNEYPLEGYERTVDVHVKNIRRIVESDRENPLYIQTVRGVGYRFAEASSL